MEVGHTVIMHRRIVIICKTGWRKLCAGRSMGRFKEWLDEFGRKGGERSPRAGVQQRKSEAWDGRNSEKYAIPSSMMLLAIRNN